MKALILAGGKGTRLWPMSRENYPKQFLSLDDQGSFLQKTVQRIASVIPYSDIFIATGESSFNEVVDQLSDMSPVFKDNTILEPIGRNTAPAIALGIKFMQEKQGVADDEVVFVTPSDHLISSEEAFGQYLKTSEQLARDGHLLTFGITPTAPETGYGYIKRGKAVSGNDAFVVDRFVEKPDEPTAKQYLASGDYYWNAGMFSFSCKTIRQELERYCPEIHQATTGSFEAMVEVFSNLPSISIDYAVMEKTDRSVVLPMTLDWSDIGSWDSLYDVIDKDDNANAKRGDVITIDTSNSLIFGGNKLITTIGLEDVIVVETDDALLIAKRGDSQRVREVVGQLKKQGRREV